METNSTLGFESPVVEVDSKRPAPLSKTSSYYKKAFWSWLFKKKILLFVLDFFGGLQITSPLDTFSILVSSGSDTIKFKDHFPLPPGIHNLYTFFVNGCLRLNCTLRYCRRKLGFKSEKSTKRQRVPLVDFLNWW